MATDTYHFAGWTNTDLDNSVLAHPWSWEGTETAKVVFSWEIISSTGESSGRWAATFFHKEKCSGVAAVKGFLPATLHMSP